MKKILSIIAVAVLLLASVSAADVSATVKVSSDLFSTSGTTVLGTLGNARNSVNDPLFSLQFSGDQAGAGVKFWGDATKGVDFGGFNVWFKPTDSIKLSFKENGLGLFGDKYNGWYAHQIATSAGGYGIQYAADALTVDLVFGENFVSGSTVGEFGVKAGYNLGDAGSVAGLFSAGSNFNTIKFGAGYSGSFGDIGAVLNVGAKIVNSAFTLGIDASAGGTVDAIGWAVDVPVTITSSVAVGLKAKGSYTLDNGIGLTLKFEDSNLLSSTFDAAFKLDIAGKVGEASWSVTPQFTCGTNVFKVAFGAGVSF